MIAFLGNGAKMLVTLIAHKTTECNINSQPGEVLLFQRQLRTIYTRL